jgi:hypothetical protein
MASGVPSTPFNTPTSYPNPPVPTVLLTGSLCVDLYQSTSDASESCTVKGFQSALCWDGIESTWGLRTPLACLAFSTADNVPVVQYSDFYGCAVGKRIATTINSITTSSTSSCWCCPRYDRTAINRTYSRLILTYSGFTLTMMSCLSILTQKLYATASSICGNENALAIDDGARHATTKEVQTVSYRRMAQYKRGFLDLSDRLHDPVEDDNDTSSDGDEDIGDDDSDEDVGDDDGDNANPGHRSDESHAPQPSPTISVTRYPAEYLVTIFAEATLLVKMPDLTPGLEPCSTARPIPSNSSSDSPSYETQVVVGCIVTAALLLLLVCIFVWLHKRKQKRRVLPNEPGVTASEEEAEQQEVFDRSGINNVSDLRSTSMLLKPQREPEPEPEPEPEADSRPTSTFRDSHDDCIYIQHPGLEMIIREGRDGGMAVRQRAPLRSTSASFSTGSSSLAHSSPAELDAVSTMIRTQISSARASSTVLPWMPGTQNHPENAFAGSDLTEANEDITKA